MPAGPAMRGAPGSACQEDRRCCGDLERVQRTLNTSCQASWRGLGGADMSSGQKRCLMCVVPFQKSRHMQASIVRRLGPGVASASVLPGSKYSVVPRQLESFLPGVMWPFRIQNVCPGNNQRQAGLGEVVLGASSLVTGRQGVADREGLTMATSFLAWVTGGSPKSARQEGRGHAPAASLCVSWA